MAAILAGLALGMIYGWIIDPVDYVDATPDILRADYRTDYVLMVAEAYQFDPNSEQAARRLAMLGSDPPAKIVNAALEYAQSQGFTAEEMARLQDLFSAMQLYRPAGGSIP